MLLLPLILSSCGSCAGSETDGDADTEITSDDWGSDETLGDETVEPAEPDPVTDEPYAEDPAEDPAPLDPTRDEDVVEDEAELPPGRLFSFAVITDTHIGEGFPDYGTEGYEDWGGAEYELTDLLLETVDKINEAAPAYGIDFVLALGDLSDSGELSELIAVRSILDGLRVPYFPLLGNHDVWPYCTDAEGSTLEPPSPVGDAFFETVFEVHFDDLARLFPGLTGLPVPVHNPEHDCASTFINYTFDYMGYHFVCLDFVSRGHALLGAPGVMPEADLHDFDGGTWPWLTGCLENLGGAGDRNVFIFSHHAPVVRFMGIDCFTPGEYGTMESFITDGGYDARIAAFFAGHWHFNRTDTTFGSLPLILTDAEKESGAVRVVQVFSDGTVNFDILL